MNANLPNWREGARPHQDIRDNQVSEALFAVNLSRAIARKGADEYRDPKLFFERTHLTRTLKSLVWDVLQTLRGEPGGNSVIHLQTNFGGGKTHAELALYHLLHSPEKALAVPQVAALLNGGAPLAGNGVPQAAVAALPCADLYAGGREVKEGFTLHTLWGEMAYRLGGAGAGAALYQLIRDSDEQRAAPGVAKLREVLAKAGPNLILIDELLHYVDKAAAVRVGDSNLGSQTLGFLRELTEAVDSVEHSVLVASVTASKMEDLQVLGDQDAQLTLSKLEDILRRVEDSRTPIEGAEIYDVVRTRLFQEIDEEVARQVTATYTQFYRSSPWKDLLPPWSRDAGYEELLHKSYPFHPSIVQVLYERWGSRVQFQLTRGTLRFLAHLLAYLWNVGTHDRAGDPLVQLSDVDLADEDVRAEAIRVAGSEWEAVIGTDIAAAERGGQSLSQRADDERGGLYTRHRLIQGVATSVFMFTHGGQQDKPTPRTDVRLAVARPSVPLSDLGQAFDDCKARLYYYYEENGGALFKTEPNPNKVLADERANVQTDDARRKVETVVEEVIGRSDLLHVNLYDFQNGRVQEPGHVPDDGELQLVVLPPRLTGTKGHVSGRTADVLDEISDNYGPRLRMNRNMTLYLVPDSDYISGAIERAIHWIAAENVKEDAGLMERFSKSQRETVRGRAVSAKNDTKDHVRKAYNTVLLPSGPDTRESFELSYVPPGKAVLEQAEEELLSKGKIHREFNPALFDGRWASLWPKTATVITTTSLWEKFTRQGQSPILTSIEVLQETIRQGVERELFGYGLLHDSDQDKLQADAYERIYLGPFDARALDAIEISQRSVLMRPAQVDVLFPPINKEEIAMVLAGPRQSVEKVFLAARRSLTVQGRVDRQSFFDAICEGVKAGSFGYAEGADAPVVRGSDVELSPGQIKFSGWLIGEEVPLPVSAGEVARLVPAEGQASVEELYQLAVTTYGGERVSEQGFLNALQRCLMEERFGYATTKEATIQTGAQAVEMVGYVGQPEALPPDTWLIRLAKSDIVAVELASVMKAATNLGRLGESKISLELRLELKGEVNEHSVTMALNELKSRVPGLKVEDVKGE